MTQPERATQMAGLAPPAGRDLSSGSRPPLEDGTEHSDRTSRLPSFRLSTQMTMDKNETVCSEPKLSLNDLPVELLDLILEHFFADRFSDHHGKPLRVFSLLGVSRKWRASILQTHALRSFFDADKADDVKRIGEVLWPRFSSLIKVPHIPSESKRSRRSLHYKRPTLCTMFYDFPFPTYIRSREYDFNAGKNFLAPRFLHAEASWRQIPLIRYPLKRIQVCLSWGKPVGPNANRGYDWCLVGDILLPGHSPREDEASLFLTLGLYVDLIAAIVPAGAQMKHHIKTGNRLAGSRMSSKPNEEAENTGVRFVRELTSGAATPSPPGGNTRFRRFVDHGVKDQACAVLHVAIEDPWYDASQVLYHGGALRAALGEPEAASKDQELPVVHWWNRIFKTAYTVGPEEAQMPEEKAVALFKDVHVKVPPTVASHLLPGHFERLYSDKYAGIADSMKELSGGVVALKM